MSPEEGGSGLGLIDRTTERLGWGWAGGRGRSSEKMRALDTVMHQGRPRWGDLRFGRGSARGSDSPLPVRPRLGSP